MFCNSFYHHRNTTQKRDNEKENKAKNVKF